MMTRARRFLRLLPLALLASALPLSAQLSSDQPIVDFQPAEYVVERSGSEIDAEVFRSQSAGAILVLSKQLEAPILLRLRDAKVETVNLMKVDRRGDGGLTLLPSPTLERSGSFTVAAGGTGVEFTVGGRPMTLSEKPPLLGAQELAGMRAYSADYVRSAAAYSPSAPILARLRSESRPVRVEIFFGSWCPYCQQMVPRMMRVAEELASSGIDFDFYGLPREIDSDKRASGADVHSVPTGIVYVSGKEAGRITGNGWRVPELALNNILVRDG